MFRFLAAICLLSAAWAQSDQTMVPYANGAGVVEATCSRIEASCVFAEDKLFTRRLAYVESYDGMDRDTFRNGYYGGIWQVDESMFELTQHSSTQGVLREPIKDIKTAFGISWDKVKWDDLLKPLYSALAARLYLEYQARSSTGIPRSIEDQADYWVRYYRPQGDKQQYNDKANTLDQGCANTNGADVIFVLDSSGSIGSSNFDKIKNFVMDVVGSFDIGARVDQYRVGVITFSSSVKKVFDLKSHFDKKDMLKAIGNITYYGGGTSTYLAIDEMTERGFTESNGARPLQEGHPRVGIVVTDGGSNSLSRTLQAALRAHNADITMFAVGVGSNLRLEELHAIASDPLCLHLILLQGFTEFESLKYVIEKGACEAPIIISPGQNSTTGGRLPPGGDQNCKIKIPREGGTVHLDVAGGSASFYLASTTYPSSDYYEHMVGADPGKLGVIFVPHPNSSNSDGTMFCNIKGDNYTESNISVGIEPGDKDQCKLKPCKNGGECVQFPDWSYECRCTSDYTGTHCETLITTTTSTTTTTTTTTTTEPPTTTSTTTTTEPPTTTSTVITTTTPTTTKPTTTSKAPGKNTYNCRDKNPCTPENTSQGKFYFPHDNPNQFVQCSEWGQCYEMYCPPGLVWDDIVLTCNRP